MWLLVRNVYIAQNIKLLAESILQRYNGLQTLIQLVSMGRYSVACYNFCTLLYEKVCYLQAQLSKLWTNVSFTQETTINSLTNEIDRLRISKGVCEREFREYRAQVRVYILHYTTLQIHNCNYDIPSKNWKKSTELRFVTFVGSSNVEQTKERKRRFRNSGK